MELRRPPTQYYPYRVRWQQADGFCLWLSPPEPGREAVWVDAQGRIPLFKTETKVTAFARQRDITLTDEPLRMANLDAAYEWLSTVTNHSIRDCLAAWSLFDDVSVGLGKPYVGNEESPVRDRIFDLLYADSGLWPQASGVPWPQVDLAILRNFLFQGFELWRKHACWQA